MKWIDVLAKSSAGEIVDLCNEVINDYVSCTDSFRSCFDDYKWFKDRGLKCRLDCRTDGDCGACFSDFLYYEVGRENEGDVNV